MKVGIIPPSTRTGESVYSKHLTEGLIGRGIEVEVLKSHFLNCRPNIKVSLGSLLLKRSVKTNELSILHNLDNLGPYLFSQRSLKTKNVLTVHDIAPVVLPKSHDWIIKFDFKVLLPKILENCDSIIAVSNATKKDLVSYLGVDDNRIDVVPLGVNTYFFYPRTKEEVELILNKYRISGDYILYAGTDNIRKNLNNLILGYARICEKIPYDLVLVGPINRNNIIKIIDKSINSENLKKRLLSKVRVLGYIDREDLPTIYTGARCFVLTSLYEGFGLPVLEAMACGTPVIISDNSSLREVGGKAALYIDNPLDSKEIAESITCVINNNGLMEKMRKRGFKQVKRFSWDKTVEKTIQIYKNILE